LAPDRLSREPEETSQERKKAKREPGKPLPSCLQRSGKGPLKVRFKEVRISEDEAEIRWAEDEYLLPPAEQPCEFEFPEEIVVPSLPGQEAGDPGVRSPARGSPGDFERGEEVEQSSVLVRPEEEAEGRDPEGPSVQEDSKSGGAQKLVLR
jgi:hypothetical protein